jgi:isopenicillin-N N-acyltransferase-like protein
MTAQLPEALEEMRGIADGSGLPYEDILLLNFSVELWGEALFGSSGRCSLIGVAGENPLLAKTIDMSLGDDRYVICQRVHPKSGHSFLHVTYAGTIWTDGGVNDAGLAQTNSTLQSNSFDRSGLPIFIVARNLLQYCQNVAEAIEMVGKCRAINQGSNILLGDANSNLVVVEKSISQGLRSWERKPHCDGQIGDVIFATNHSLTPEMEGYLSGSETFLSNSRERLANLKRKVREMARTVEGVMALYRDHSLPGAICQHGEASLHTTGAFIIVPKQRRIWIASGYPCASEYSLLAL